MKTLFTIATIFLCTANAVAQPAQTFPEAAETPTADALREALAGKVFSVTPSKGPDWRWQFDSNGYFFINVGSFRNSGKWSTKDGSICQDTGRITGCNDVRTKDGVLYLKRDNGEIILLQLQK